MSGLIDGNNFFVSCERVFNPSLLGIPVLVLSNNDGCIVARSNEVKKLGIKMGTPFFKIESLIEKYNIQVFSSNLSLYGDMSDRMMQVFSGFVKDLEVYSIDECFLDLNGYNKYHDLKTYGKEIISATKKNIGIPASLGIAATKTLAKVASKFAKKYPSYEGVCMIDTEEKRTKALKLIQVEDIWGIGSQYSKILNYNGVKSAFDFTLKKESWVRKYLKVQGVRTWKELLGEKCYDLETNPLNKQNICTSRSFGEMVNDYETLTEAVANFAAACARKLREQNSCASMLTVFILTNRFREDLPQYFESKTIILPTPSNLSGELISTARNALQLIYKKGYSYKKAGVTVSQIVPSDQVQLSLWDEKDRVKLQRIYNTVDRMNQKNGMNRIKMAVQGNNKKWHLKNEHISRLYTTSWDDLITIQ